MSFQRFSAFLLVIVVAIAAPISPAVQIASAQSEAGFLDQLGPEHRDPFSIFEGSAWYCLEPGMEWDEGYQMWVPVMTIVSGGFVTEPDCNAGRLDLDN